MKGEIKKIQLSPKEIYYISGLLEAQRSRIDFLGERDRKRDAVIEDLKIAEKIEKKIITKQEFFEKWMWKNYPEEARMRLLKDKDYFKKYN